jgi:uncharacterized protein
MRTMFRMRPLRILLLLPLIVPLAAFAGDVPFLAGRVNDTAGLLHASTVSELEALLRAHEDSTSNQIVVLTVPSLDGEAIEEFSMRVVETWKLGRSDRDNGILLLVARDERNVRIEVGNGLEGDLPDITCGKIIRHEIVPRFRDGDFDGGIRAGVRSIIAAIGGSYTADGTGSDEDGDGSGTLELIPRLIALTIFFVVIGVFTTVTVFTTGCQSWFLYVFLIPFWAAFPSVLLGPVPGIILLGMYLLGAPAAKLWFQKSEKGKRLLEHWMKARGMSGIPVFGGKSSGGGWSSSGGGGGGFSGGGGGFSGGGASGGW